MPANTSASMWERFAHALTIVLTMCVFAACMMVLLGVQQLSRSDWPLPLLLLPLWPAVVLVHELGHVMAASFSGSTILGMSVGPLWLQRRRHGIRFRWTRQPRNVGGMAMAVPDFSTTSANVRQQMLWFIAGGPLANLLVAVALLAWAWPKHGRWDEMVPAVVFVFALLNLLTGFVNLLPRKLLRATDGAQLAAWWTNSPLVVVQSRILRMYALSLRGVCASELAAEDIAELETSDMVGVRLFGSYIALRAAQQRADAQAFAAIMQRCRETVVVLDQTTYFSIRGLWTLCLVEEAFEQLCAGNAFGDEIDGVVLKTLPKYFSCRLSAARARAEGDVQCWASWMRKAARDADGVFDIATRIEEPRLLARIAKPLDRPVIPVGA
ncbi:MAG: M50 family metallopeptidase [Dokdonella sp.]